jgi:methionine-gamma-lyase
MKKRDISTVAVHAGAPAVRDPYGAHVAPLYQTSTFVFESAEAGRLGFAGEAGGASHLYTRLGNPTMDAFERALAALEGEGVRGGEVHALAYASGMAAITTTILALARGGHVIAQEALYGCTSEFLKEQAPELGIDVTFVDSSQTAEVAAALRARPDTKLVFLESPANPTLALADLQAISAVAHEVGALVCVDNTFATPYHQRPLALGVDIVAHSTTKYIGGHGTVIGGALVVRDAALLPPLQLLRKNLGGVPSPFDCWLLLNGLKTFALRMQRHAENAQKVAEWLEAHPAVARVHYPGLASHPQHALARRQMERGFGGVLAFELAGGYEAGERMMDAVELCTLAVSLGTVDTLIQHPASMTHSVMAPEMRQRAGITDGLVRLSVGIEHVDDLVADLAQALEHAAAVEVGRVK